MREGEGVLISAASFPPPPSDMMQWSQNRLYTSLLTLSAYVHRDVISISKKE